MVDRLDGWVVRKSASIAPLEECSIISVKRARYVISFISNPSFLLQIRIPVSIFLQFYYLCNRLLCRLYWFQLFRYACATLLMSFKRLIVDYSRYPISIWLSYTLRNMLGLKLVINYYVLSLFSEKIRKVFSCFFSIITDYRISFIAAFFPRRILRIIWIFSCICIFYF